MAEEFEDQELTEHEREGLAALRNSPRIPATLEGRVVTALQKEGLITGRGQWTKTFALAAAGILLFVLGWASARWHFAAPKEKAQDQYVLFLEKGAESFVTDSQAEKSAAHEYAEWGRRISAAGHPAVGERLANSGVDLDSVRGTEVSWSPTPESLRGYFIISARGLAEAVEVARTCPHLKYGGRIEVRPINTPR